jgi:hypothetical protein
VPDQRHFLDEVVGRRLNVSDDAFVVLHILDNAVGCRGSCYV